MKKRIFLIFTAAVLLLSLCGCQRDGIEFNYFSGNFDPFFARSVQDMSVVGLTQESLLVTSGDEQASMVLDGYTQGLGIADIELDYEGEQTICTVKIGEDIYFSDGVQLTAKDVVFSMYVYASLDYDGWSSFNTAPIVGLTDYQYGNSTADELAITDEMIAAELENMSDITAERIKNNIIRPILEEEYKWVSTLYDDPAFKGTEVEMHIEQYTEPTELFAYYYSIDKAYTGADDTEENAVETIVKQYGTDYKLLGDVYGSDLSDMVEAIARRTLTEKALEGQPRDVYSISGIERIDDFTIRVTIDSDDPAELETVFGIYVAPCHYYGGEGADVNWGDGLVNAFTVDHDTFNNISEKSRQPLGAGRYVFGEYKEGEYVTFKKNPDYHRDVELENKLTFVVTGDSSKLGNNGYLVTPENRMYVES